MNMIAKLKHYTYSLYFDVKNFKYIRDSLLMFLTMIGVSWFICIAMLAPWIFPVVLTLFYLSMWLYVYFTKMYPMVNEVMDEKRLREKYPYLYNKFVDKE